MPTTVNLSGPSAGYAGTVDAAQWADLLPDAGGSIYGVNGMNDWRPTIGGTGDRAVTLAAGSGWGHGVRDVSAAPITLNHDAATGERWDLIVARRTWATKVTCFTIIQGSATKALPARNTSPGTLDDQPVALVRIVGNSVVDVVNLLVYPGPGGVFAVDRLALSYLDPLGTQIRISDTLWFATFNMLNNGVWKPFDVTPDTGWVDATRNSGWGWSFSQVRRIGAIVFYRFAAQRQTGWAPDNEMAEIPFGFRPDVDHYALTGNSKEFKMLTSGKVLANSSSPGLSNATLCGSFPAAAS